VAVEIDEEEAKALAFASARVRAFTDGHAIERVLYVPGRLINIVVS
jgi:leucyl-tRNA synthetase